MIRLTKWQVIAMHGQLVSETGGLNGLRDETLLESALGAPFQCFGDVELFPSIESKAPRLAYGLIRNHAFVDGNKRIGAHVMLVFLTLNGVDLSYSQDELYGIVSEVASSSSGFEDLQRWIRSHRVSP